MLSQLVPLRVVRNFTWSAFPAPRIARPCAASIASKQTTDQRRQRDDRGYAVQTCRVSRRRKHFHDARNRPLRTVFNDPAVGCFLRAGIHSAPFRLCLVSEAPTIATVRCPHGNGAPPGDPFPSAPRSRPAFCRKRGRCELLLPRLGTRLGSLGPPVGIGVFHEIARSRGLPRWGPASCKRGRPVGIPILPDLLRGDGAHEARCHDDQQPAE